MKFLSNYHYFALSVIIFVCAKVNGQEVETQTITVTPLSDSENKNCTQQLLDWCKNNAYPSGENFVSVMSYSFSDGQTSSRISCIVNSKGTDCTRNGDPWYHCYPNNTFTYKGAVIENSDSSVDDHICKTRDTALRRQISFTNGAMRSVVSYKQHSFGNRPTISAEDPIDNDSTNVVI